MYRYDEFDHQFVRERVAQFRDQAERRLKGELTEDEFRPLRLMNGLYLQLHAYMLRIAVPYGTLSSRQMNRLADIAEKWDRGYGHFTTRQNIQFNWIKLEDTADILAALADVEMHAIQTSGNCIRNVTTDHWAGAAADEIGRSAAGGRADPPVVEPASRILLPAAQVQDRRDRRAARPRRREGARHRPAPAPERQGRARLGGDRRRRPGPHAHHRRHGARVPARGGAASPISKAIMRVYNLYGRRDNKFKARIKILVHELGADKFKRRGRGRVRQALRTPASRSMRASSSASPPISRPGRSRRCRSWSPPFEEARTQGQGFRPVGEGQRRPASDAGLRHRQYLAQARRRHSRRRHRRADAHRRRSRLALLLRRDARQPSPESRAAACEARRSLHDLEDPQGGRPGGVQYRARRRHHRLPGSRLLRAGDRPLDPGLAGDLAPLRRPEPPAGHRSAQDQHLGLHQCLRPSSRRQHRHPRPR